MKALITLCRPVNCVMAAAASLLGSWLTIHRFDAWEMWIGSLVVALVTAGGNIINDLCDIPADRINHPNRPLVTGEVSKSYAVGLLSFCWGSASIVSAFLLNDIAAWFVLAAILLLLAYAFLLSRLPFLGNIVVAVLGAAGFAAGVAMVLSIPDARISGLGVLASLLAFFVHLSRELIKTSIDLDGDRMQGRMTVATLLGKTSPAIMATGILAGGVWSSCAAAQLSWNRDAMYLLSFYLPVLFLIFITFQSRSRGFHDRLTLTSTGLKLYLGFGILVILMMDILKVPVSLVLP